MSTVKDRADDFSFKPFKDLSKIIENKGLKLSERQFNVEQDNLSDDDIFKLAINGVKENKEFRMLKVEQRRLLKTTQKVDPDKEVLEILSGITQGTVKIDLTNTQEYCEWLNPKYSAFYSKDLTRKLHAKRYSVQDFIDLHGMTLSEAEKAVDDFIRDALKRSLRCVKFIHGRGLKSKTGCAVIKESLIKWLTGRYHKHVIAFATAQHNDGGLGAMYVLLRKRPPR